MRASRSLDPIPLASSPTKRRDDAVLMLSEIVAQLSERVELLETRERLTRTTLSMRKAGTAKPHE